MSKKNPEVQDLESGRHPENSHPPDSEPNQAPLAGVQGIDPEERPDNLVTGGDKSDKSRGSGARRSQH